MTANGISYNFKPFWNRENVNWCSSLFKTGDMDSDSNLNLQYNTLFLYKKKSHLTVSKSFICCIIISIVKTIFSPGRISKYFKSFKSRWWLTPLILATQETEIRRTEV
jgi:hypothetical protein